MKFLALPWLPLFWVKGMWPEENTQEDPDDTEPVYETDTQKEYTSD